MNENKQEKETGRSLREAAKIIIDLAVDAKREIAAAVVDAKTLLASAAMEASKVVSATAAENQKTLHANTIGDHDVITHLVDAVENLDKKFTAQFSDLKTDLKADIKDLKEGNSQRISSLEKEKLNQSDSYVVCHKERVDKLFEDQEERLRWQRDKIISVMAWGGLLLFLIGVAEPIILKFWK